MSDLRAPLPTHTSTTMPTDQPQHKVSPHRVHGADTSGTAPSAATVTQPSWRWPAPIETYERSPSLRPHEVAALAELAGRFGMVGVNAPTPIGADPLSTQRRPPQRRGRNSRGGVALRRLVQPLEDVLAATHANRQVTARVISLLLTNMHLRQVAYWGWTEDDWVAAYQSSTFLKRSANTKAKKARPGYATAARHHAVVVAYLLGGVTHLHRFGGRFKQRHLADTVFGSTRVAAAIERVCATLRQWGYQEDTLRQKIPRAICEALLANHSPCLEDLSYEVLDSLRARSDLAACIRPGCTALARVLVDLGILQQPLPRFERSAAHMDPSDALATPDTPDTPDTPRWRTRGGVEGEIQGQRGTPGDGATANVPGEWLVWVQRWRMTSTLAQATKKGVYEDLLRTGRWLAEQHPEVRTPGDWTRALAAEYVAAVDQMVAGQWTSAHAYVPAARRGQPLAAATKDSLLGSMRMFFRDCQEWGWIPRQFDVQRSMTTPKSIRALLGPNPRNIADDIWAKLLWAGLNLTEEDLPRMLYGPQHDTWRYWYPLEMVRALTIVWLFCGLRSQEIRRLRVGCIRWQRDSVRIPGTTEVLPKDAVCLLDIPVQKTGPAFTKPVDLVAGEAIQGWEQVRPQQPLASDAKTGERVHLLFAYRNRPVGGHYINGTLIPMLCRKAGIPRKDARGDITSHRARSTIATQLFNAKEPLTLFELQAWLGHRSPASTQYYARIAPTRLAKSYEQAGYFGRNLRTIEVLVDREAVTSGAAATGAPWRYYDLGHGYCTYEFFEQCPHRMACAKCSYYRPKPASVDLLREGQGNLLRMLQEIPLTDDERAAVDDGIEALAKLSEQLADVPTPAGPTPRQLSRPPSGGRRPSPVLPVLPVLPTQAGVTVQSEQGVQAQAATTPLPVAARYTRGS